MNATGAVAHGKVETELSIMNGALQRIKAWRFRRELRSLERWEQLRVEGKTRFVVRSALTYGLVFVGMTHAVEQFFDGPHPISLYKLIFLTLFGVGMGLSAWSDMESKYKRALREGLLAPLDRKTLPHGKL